MPRDDDYGQVDGEQPFATSMHARPWMRGAAAPWHLWGNTQTLTLPPIPFTSDDQRLETQTLVRVAYGRPETWRFLVHAKLLTLPEILAAEQSNINLLFEVMAGIGRSVIRFSIVHPGLALVGPAGPLAEFDLGATNQWQPVTSAVAATPSDNFVAQDITIVARANFVTTNPTTPAVLEVSAQLSPNVHTRPDWYMLDADPSEQFAGEEIRGR